MVVPELPAELLVEVARRVQSAQQLTTMESVCLGWRNALRAQEAVVWKPVALRRFPRLEKMLELHRSPADCTQFTSDGRVHVAPVNYRHVYEAQLRAEAPSVPGLPASPTPSLDDFIFTVEFVLGYPTGNVLGSWTGTFLPSQVQGHTGNNHPPMRITDFSLSAEAKEFLRAGDGYAEVGDWLQDQHCRYIVIAH